MERHFCDKCKKEIKSDFWNGHPRELTVMYSGYELCHDCFKSFKNWFNTQ